MELISVAIGVGLAVSLMFSEMFGLAAGGMVVPGYIAVSLDRPLSVIFTLVAALATFLIVHLLGTFVIIYGKRRTVLMILVGYLVRLAFNAIPLGPLQSLEAVASGRDSIEVIGYIIPGLIAIWIDRQGMVETLSALVTASVVIRLLLIFIYGTQLAL